MLRSSGVASSRTSPDGIDLAADVGDLALEGGRPFGDGVKDRERRARPADGVGRAVDGGEEAREREELQRLERASFDRQSGEHALELRRRLDGDLTHPPGSGRSRVVAASAAATAFGSVAGCERGQACLALRGLRKAADHLDNAVEFKGPQGASVHAVDVMVVTAQAAPSDEGNR